MQDVTVVKTCINGREDMHMFGVFDGHGGLECARYVGGQILSTLMERMAENEYDEAKIEECVRVSFEVLNEEVKSYEIPNGTCAIICLVYGNTVVTGCLGDSRAVLARSNGEEACLLNTMLMPSSLCEKKRINDLGGFVHQGRVAGVLAVSRALGDVAFQPFVSPVPSIDVVELQNDDPFLILACDGVFDVFTENEVVALVQNVSDARTAAAVIRDAAYFAGSRDNISVVVIRMY
jgi:serine/threonine protein phosphatase PrpC